MNIPYLGEIAGLATSISWTFTAMLFAEASRRMGSFQVNLLRIPLALIFLTTSYSLIYDNYSVTNFQLWRLALSGVIGLVFGDTCLFESFVRIGPRLTLLIFSLYPAMAATIAFFFLGEEMGLFGLMGILITISGIALVLSDKAESATQHKISWKGIILALGGGLGQAVGLVLAKSALRTNMNPMLATIIRLGGGAIFIWPAAALVGRLHNPIRVIRGKLSALPFLIGGTFFGPFMGIWLSMVSVQNTATGIAATLMSLMPIFIIPLEIIFHNERPSVRAVFGTVVAVVGVAILFLR